MAVPTEFFRRRCPDQQPGVYYYQPAPVVPIDHGPDGLRFHFTGAASNGAAQDDQSLSLGGYRASDEAERIGLLALESLAPLRIVLGSGLLGDAPDSVLIRQMDADEFSLSAPGGSLGLEQLVAVGEEKTLVDGANPSQWVRVRRLDDAGAVGADLIAEAHPQYGNLFAGSDVTSSQAGAGTTLYRAVMLRNAHEIAITGIAITPRELGTLATTVSGLGASGSGTIAGSALAFRDWPLVGWARIETSGGVLKEIVYYSSRTHAALTVPANGRSRLGTSATSGAAGDKLRSVPGARVAFEAASPLVGGSVQAIASETTTPTGLSWSTSVSVGTLAPGQQGAIWIARDVPTGSMATPIHQVDYDVAYVTSGAARAERLRGYYRVANAALERWELLIGQDAAPDPSAAPAATGTSLPLVSGVIASSHTYYVVLRRRNQWNLASDSAPRIIVVNGSGIQVTAPPSSPTFVEFVVLAPDKVQATATYEPTQDGANRATHWLVYLRTNGTDPNPSIDTPVVVAMGSSGAPEQLVWASGSLADGLDARILVRVRRSSDSVSSTNVDVHQITTGAATAEDLGVTVFYRKVAEQKESP